jgi:hypothetical protein
MATSNHHDPADSQNLAWKEFRDRFAMAASLVDANLLVASSPPANSPGRRYYANLAFFLGDFSTPSSSIFEERKLYIEFIRRMDAANQLNPGIAEQVAADLMRTMGQGE